jgi:hypothetical protein
MTYRWWELKLLSYRSEVNLVLGALFDLLFFWIVVLLVGVLSNIYIPLYAQVGIAFLPAMVVYLWSTNLFRNHVATYEKGVVTFLERIVPSGPNGSGLPPGYYWLPLGWPFYKLAIKQSTLEVTVPFNQMQVWTANNATHRQGAINGEIDGNAQFEVIDPGQYNSVAQVDIVLRAIVEEGARDVCERLTIEEFIATRNDALAGDIDTEINNKLAARSRPLGVRLNGVNVTRTDNKSQAVTSGWDQITVQQSLATARATDAAGRVRRIRAYKATGVDANRAAALDAVVSDKSGATVGDQRYNVDVGESLKDIGRAIIAKVGGP